MGRIRRMLRGGLSAVSAVVSRNELFERPGERSPTSPLVPRPTQAAATPESVVAPKASADEESPPASPVEVLDLPRLKTWLGAGRGLRVVNHWATWCIPCVEEFDILKSLHAQLPDGVPLVGLSWDLFDPRGDEDDIAEHVANFAAGHHLPWPSALIGESVDPAEFFAAVPMQNQTVPQTWLVNDAGDILHRIEGVLTADHVGALLSAIYSTGGDFGEDTDG